MYLAAIGVGAGADDGITVGCDWPRVRARTIGNCCCEIRCEIVHKVTLETKKDVDTLNSFGNLNYVQHSCLDGGGVGSDAIAERIDHVRKANICRRGIFEISVYHISIFL